MLISVKFYTLRTQKNAKARFFWFFKKSWGMMSARECRGKVLLELFQKLAVSRGRASCGTGRVGNLSSLQLREGEKNSPVDCFSLGTLAGGSQVRSTK